MGLPYFAFITNSNSIFFLLPALPYGSLRVGRVGENSGNAFYVFDDLFPEKYTVKDHISTNWLMPPGHPIILLKSN